MTSRSASKLTPELHKMIVDVVRSGKPVDIAVDKARVSRQAFYYWCKRGEEGIDPYHAFMLDVMAAKAEACGDTIDTIAASSSGGYCEVCKRTGDWKAAAWLGERLHPKVLQLTQKTEVLVQQGVESLLDMVQGPWGDRSLTYGEFVALIDARVRGVAGEEAGGVVVEAAQLGSGD